MDRKEKKHLEQLFRSPDIDSIIIGMDKSELELALGVLADHMKENEWIYIITKKCFGLFNKKLFLYFRSDKVYEFYLGY